MVSKQWFSGQNAKSPWVWIGFLAKMAKTTVFHCFTPVLAKMSFFQGPPAHYGDRKLKCQNWPFYGPVYDQFMPSLWHHCFYRVFRVLLVWHFWPCFSGDFRSFDKTDTEKNQKWHNAEIPPLTPPLTPQWTTTGLNGPPLALHWPLQWPYRYKTRKYWSLMVKSRKFQKSAKFPGIPRKVLNFREFPEMQKTR